MPGCSAIVDKIESSLKKCNFSQSFKHLKYLMVGYKPGQTKYINLNHILSIIGYAIYKGYCISENKKKYLDLVRLTKTEFLKTSEVVKSLKNDMKHTVVQCLSLLVIFAKLQSARQ